MINRDTDFTQQPMTMTLAEAATWIAANKAELEKMVGKPIKLYRAEVLKVYCQRHQRSNGTKGLKAERQGSVRRGEWRVSQDAIIQYLKKQVDNA